MSHTMGFCVVSTSEAIVAVAEKVKKDNTLRRHRIGVSAMFFINGAIFANWVARIPEVQEKLSLSEGDLGLVLLGLSAGVLTALPLAGGLISRFGSRAVTVVGGLALALALPLLGIAETFVSLWLGLFVFGASLSMMDMAMNAQGVAVEKGWGSSVMSSFHGLFSLGGVAGALLGSLMVSLSLGVATHFVVVTVVFGALTLYIASLLAPVEGEQGENNVVFSLPHRAVWGLGLVAFCSALGEGVMQDWSTVYLAQVVSAPPAQAALGFAAFSTMMTVGRLTGDAITTRTNPVHVVRYGGLLATCGLLLAIFVPSLTTGLIGFALVGAGLSTVIPLAFSAAGRVPGVAPGIGLAGVATLGYSAFLAGPPIVGLVAEATSLRVALGTIAVVVSVLMFAARAVRRR